MAESEKELQCVLMRMKKEREKSRLKLNIKKKNNNKKKLKIMASGPITSWQIEEGKVKAVTDFLFLGSQITTDSDCMKVKNVCSLEGKL